MRVSDIMSRKAVSVREDDTLDKVIKLLTNFNITGCPVVDHQENVIGVVAQTDILKFVNVYGKVNQYSKFESLIQNAVSGGRMDLSKLKRAKVKDFGRKKVITVNDSHNIRDVIRVMDRYDVERLPVVKKNKLMGIVTRKDVIKALTNMQ
jgi:predicted transcriptional regulator